MTLARFATLTKSGSPLFAPCNGAVHFAFMPSPRLLQPKPCYALPPGLAAMASLRRFQAHSKGFAMVLPVMRSAAADELRQLPCSATRQTPLQLHESPRTGHAAAQVMRWIDGPTQCRALPSEMQLASFGSSPTSINLIASGTSAVTRHCLPGLPTLGQTAPARHARKIQMQRRPEPRPFRAFSADPAVLPAASANPFIR
jgi:hypothetical protein